MKSQPDITELFATLSSFHVYVRSVQCKQNLYMYKMNSLEQKYTWRWKEGQVKNRREKRSIKISVMQ